MCADEQEYIANYYYYVKMGTSYGRGQALIFSLVLQIHRRHCKLCRPDFSRTTFNAVQPPRITHRVAKGAGG